MDSFFDNIATHLGDQVSGDHIKLIACIMVTYPLALIYRKLPVDSPTSRHLFSIVYAFISMTCVLKLYIGFFHMAITAILTYTFMKYYQGKNGPYINFVLAMISMSIWYIHIGNQVNHTPLLPMLLDSAIAFFLFLTMLKYYYIFMDYSHIDRQNKGFEGSSKLDYSGALMIATIKFTSFGFNIADGRGVAATDYNKRMKIAPYPSLIEYFGWLCYFGGFLVGPTCEYMDYYRFTNYYFVSRDKNISPYKPALQKFVSFLATAWIVAFVGQRYNYFLMLEDDFATLPFYKKLFAFEVTGRVQHCKYGCLWLLAEGASVLSGLGYNGVKDGKHRWDRVSNVNWYDLETAQSCRDLSNAWNLGSNVWLRHYVYMRFCPPGTKPTSFALVATYTVSASWHGFHPGYYALLSSFGMFQVLGRRVRYIVRPFTVSPTDGKTPLPGWKTLYDTACYITTTYTTAILMAPFELLYVSRTLKVWASIYYIHVWGYMITWGFVTFLGPMLLRIQKHRKEQALLKHKELIMDGHEQDVKRLKIKRNLI